MSAAIITARLDPEMLALVDKVAKANGRSRSWFAARAIEQAARQEEAFLAFVQDGIDAADRRELIDRAEMEGWFDDRIARHRARCDD